jgi:peptidoglycan hydrolase-like protein with peptidoglycan-binding domain
MPFGRIANWFTSLFSDEDDEVEGIERLRGRWQRRELPRDADSGGRGLHASVGRFGRNRRRDVAKVEALLDRTDDLDLDRTGGPTGYFGAPQEEGIKRFQRRKGLEVDGLINPKGPTLASLLGETPIRRPAASAAPIPALKPRPPTIHNPIGGFERNDDAGEGWFGALRGQRRHRGVDILGSPGDPVVAPFDGVIKRRGWPYADRSLDLVEIEGTVDHKGLGAKLFYVDRRGPKKGDDTGTPVQGGRTILGRLQNIRK